MRASPASETAVAGDTRIYEVYWRPMDGDEHVRCDEIDVNWLSGVRTDIVFGFGMLSALGRRGKLRFTGKRIQFESLDLVADRSHAATVASG